MATTLFAPTQLGPLPLANHLVMAPMSRSRAFGNLANDLIVEYYRQRATAGLIVTEGLAPSPNGLGYARMAGLFTSAQAASWRSVTEAVHAQGGRIYAQLMHAGRQFHPLNLPAGAEGVSPSAVAAPGTIYTDQQQLQPNGQPRALRAEELSAVRDEFVRSAQLACGEAGFDGVELHGANGYLLESFLHPSANHRTDAYGGSIENRARFVLEVAQAVATAIGTERTGIRLSPWGVFGGLEHYPEIEETYAYLATELQKIGLVYVHLVDHSSMGAPAVPPTTVAAIRARFTNTLILSGGYHTVAGIKEALHGAADLVAIGRPFVANPDLVERLRQDLPLAQPDPATLYAIGPEGPTQGYIDYPLANGQAA